MHLTRAWMIAAAAALALFAASCGSDSSGAATAPPPVDNSQADVLPEETPAAEETPDAEEPSDDSAATVEEEELDGALVDSFPSDVPLYDGEIESSKSGLNSFGDPEWNAAIITNDAMESVDASIREAYSADGWTLGSELEFAGGYLLTARSEDYTVSLTYNDMTGPVTINYGVSANG